MRIIILLLLTLATFVCNAQTPSDSVFVAKGFLGYKFYQKDARLNFNQLPYIMEANDNAFALITKAKKNNTISSIVSGTGTFLIGWQVAAAIVGGDPNWLIMGVGGGLIVISIPIYSKSYRQSLEAVDLYNQSLGLSSSRKIISLGITKYGIGLSLEF